MSTRSKPAALYLVVMLGAVSCFPAGLPAQDQSVHSRAWTLDEAMEQLQWYPRDPYLQYVALQLARREEGASLADVTSRIDQLQRRRTFWSRSERVDRVDLFNIFTGALAIQESLQLDTMGAGTPGEEAIGRRASNPANGQPQDPIAPDQKIQVRELTGPTIKSHPWQEMLGSKRPEISPLAYCVPADFYFIEFRSVKKLLEAMDEGDLWGQHLLSQSSRAARTQQVGERIRKQLAIETNRLFRPFYDLVVTEAAITGSDLFVREGSDVTVLFRFQQPGVFKKQMEQYLSQAAETNPDARRTKGDVQGIPFDHVSTPDRSVHVFAAYPQPDLHVRTNSRTALERVIAAIQGKYENRQPVQRLGDSTEFAYIRSIMPRGAAEEDGFVYLSDPFIRRMVGPELKLTERRRMVCYNHLRMIGHASMMHRTEQGKPAQSLAELERSKCTPGSFGQGNLACPDGGRYSLSPDGLSGVCSHHGHAECLTPCCEIPVAEVSAAEAAAYRRFLDAYNQYWRTFFDPIAIRVEMTPRQYRVETMILPLIDNSIYTGLAQATGGTAEPLDYLPVPKRNIFSLAMHVDKRGLLAQAGLEGILDETGQNPDRIVELDTVPTTNKLRMIGLALHNYHDTHRQLPTAVEFDESGNRNRLSWRVHLLPFLGHEDLYRQFKLDEPWDSEHNRQFITQIPAALSPSNEQLAKRGMTRFVAARGNDTVFSLSKQVVRFADVTDGTSNTILCLESDDEHAVIWTKPDDLPITMEKPLQGLAARKPGGVLVLMGDGSVQFLRTTIDPASVAAMYTRNGGESVQIQDADRLPLISRRRGGPLGLAIEGIERLELGELLTKGVGNQVGLHVYDAEPMFAFNLPSFLGQVVGSFQNRGSMALDNVLAISMLISSLNSPVYLSIPVQDPAVVDLFLGRLDAYLAVALRQEDWGFFDFKRELYRLRLKDQLPARGLAVEFGPVKWRFFWARIGNGLYVASQPVVLEDLVALNRDGAPHQPIAAAETDAHALIRIRPQNWQRVLPSYQLGWAENNRESCLQNLGPLSHVCRAVSGPSAGDQKKQSEHVHELAARIYGAQFYCPDGGQYLLSRDGKQVTCTVHGSQEAPQQRSAPTPDSPVGRQLTRFSNLTVALTFLEDGLRAVMTLERKGE